MEKFINLRHSGDPPQMLTYRFHQVLDGEVIEYGKFNSADMTKLIHSTNRV